jgi:hypothetical protein
MAPGDASTQGIATVSVGENFRREPNGIVLARVDPGTPLEVLSSSGNWTEVVLEGWLWLQSLQASQDAGFDVVVSAEGGENLRSGPSGTILGRLEEGALLTELERETAWVRASRTGWIWTASLTRQTATGPSSPSVDPRSASTGAPRTDPSVGARPAARSPGGYTTLGAVGGPILAAPDGDTVAVALPASDVEVLRREGSWARVRVEGWMWLPEVGQAAEPIDEVSETVALEPDDLRLAPQAHAGRVVQWDLQFISLERAEVVRTDFFEGEPFLLARFGGANGPFVYVAVPSDRLTEVDGLVPLERISVIGRVRTGASALTGAPIVDLITIERLREDP